MNSPMPQQTHIALNGKRVPCHAKKRSCIRQGHQTLLDADFEQFKQEVGALANKPRPNISPRIDYPMDSERFEHIVKSVGSEKPRVAALIQELKNTYGLPAMGATRMVFSRGDGYVIKVPINDDGKDQNKREVKVSKKLSPEGVKMYKCEESLISGVKVLVAEKVYIPKTWKEHERLLKNLPWRFQLEDNEQIGISQDGSIVCYDL